MEDREEFLKRFGRHIKKLRERKGVSGAELARRCYMDKPNLRRLEQGKTNPTLVTLIRISQALDIRLEELFQGFDEDHQLD